MSSQPLADREDYEIDPVFLHSRREAVVIFLVWFVCLMWTVPVSYLLGYGREVAPDNVSTVMGIPTWTFWGVVVPWLAADVVTTWFCFCYLSEDDLSESEADQHSAGDAATDGGAA